MYILHAVRHPLILGLLILMTYNGSSTAAPATEVTAPTASISTSDTTAADRAIERRLTDLYQHIDGLEKVAPQVDAGVVTLTGTALTSNLAATAEQLATQVEGVVRVARDIRIETSLKIRLQHSFEALERQALQLISLLPLLLVAAAVVFAFWWLSRRVRQLSAPFDRLGGSAFVAELLRQFSAGLVFLCGLMLALVILDATAIIGSLLGAAGLIGLAVGFAIRDTVENYLASILLSIRQPFAPNDFIRIDDYEGKVIRLTSRATQLMTLDGNHLRLPNALVFKAVILNYSRNPQRRFDFEVGVDTEVNLTIARALAVATLQETEGVSAEPLPLCLIEALGDSNVILRLYAWTDQTRFDYAKVRSAAILRVKAAFDDAGLDMPEPIYRLRVQNASDAELRGADACTERDELGSPPATSAQNDATTQLEHANLITTQIDDLSPDNHLDATIAAEAEAESGHDLLSENGPRE